MTDTPRRVTTEARSRCARYWRNRLTARPRPSGSVRRPRVDGRELLDGERADVGDLRGVHDREALDVHEQPGSIGPDLLLGLAVHLLPLVRIQLAVGGRD